MPTKLPSARYPPQDIRKIHPPDTSSSPIPVIRSMPTLLPRTVPVITMLALVAANAAGTVRATGVVGPGSCRGWQNDRGASQDGEYRLLLLFGI